MAAPLGNGRLGARPVDGRHRSCRAGSDTGIAEVQRIRMLMAMASAVRELGAGQVTVSEVVSRSGVSRRTFYELFGDREDCLRCALEEGLQRACLRVLPAWRQQGEWREAMRAGLAAFLGFLDEQPTFGMLLVLDALSAGDEALRRRAQVIEALVDVVDRGRSLARSSKSVSRMTALGVVGAVLCILHSRLLSERREPMVGLLGQLMGIVVAPYLGPAAAARELRTRSPRMAPSRPAGVDGDPLRELNMRLTRRTALVLRAIAQRPGGSNAQVAVDSGVADQGQISKLLARLAGVGLVSNLGGGRGEANSWWLTERGERVEQAIGGRIGA